MSTRLIKYSGEIGRKPSSPAFLYDFHNDTSGGTTVVDRFGNSGNLTLNGTLGTAWTARRGWITPSGTLNATSGTAYGLQAMPVLSPGTAFCIGFRWFWNTTKTSTTEIVLQIGRASATPPYAHVQFGLNSSGILNFLLRGQGASATSGGTFGSSTLYVANREYSGLFHCAVHADGIQTNGFLDGVQVGGEWYHLWSANSGSTPDASSFADGLTLLSNRQGASSYAQYVGASSGGTSIANVLAVSMDSPDIGAAQALAHELHNNPRYVGPILEAF